MSRKQITFLVLAGIGLLTFVLGLVWDASMHATDPTLAEHEGIFTLSNPAHLIMGLGIGLTALGVLCALGEALIPRASRPRRARLAIGAGAVVAAFGLAAVGAIASGTDHHAHGAEAASGPAEGHTHGHGKHTGPSLPAGTKTGDAHRLQQLPDVNGASSADRAAAQKLYDDTVRATARFRDVKAAEAAGYKVEAKRSSSEMQSTSGKHKLLLHVANRALKSDGRTLDPSHPETLVYYNPPSGGSPVLAGALFSIPRDQAPPATGGTITRWHFHDHCVPSGSTTKGAKHKALKQLKAEGKIASPGADGTCPAGDEKLEGKRLMMHVWFTGDLRSAFAVHAPKKQLRASLNGR